MKFVVDANLPPDLAVWIDQRGFDAIPVRTLGVRGVTDEAIWSWATANRAVIITKDGDFPAQRARLSHGPQVLWLRIGNSTKPVLFNWLAAVWERVIDELNTGSAVVEVRRPRQFETQ